MEMVAEWKSDNSSVGSPVSTVPSPFSTARTDLGAPDMLPCGLLTPAPTSAGMMRTSYGPGRHKPFAGQETSPPGSRVALTRKLVNRPVAIQTLPVALVALQALLAMPKLGNTGTRSPTWA